MSLEPPTCRAAIRDGRVTLNAWTPSLLGSGPEPAGFASITAALCDLTMLDDELIVTPVPRAPWCGEAEVAILGWAETVGYTRVWVPGRVVSFEDWLVALDSAAVVCPTCGASWQDGSDRFWVRVRRSRWFPGSCLACGGSLPEWTVVSDHGLVERHRSRG